MGTLTKVLDWRLLLFWALVNLTLLPGFESASVFRRMIHDGGEKQEQFERIHRVQDIYLNRLESKRPFAVFPFWNKAHGTSTSSPNTSSPTEITTTTTTVHSNPPSSINVDIEFPTRRNLSRKFRTSEAEDDSSVKAALRTRQRRRRTQGRSGISRIRRTTTPLPRDGITPTILTQLRTVSEMLVTRNVTSTRTVTESPLHLTPNDAFILEDFTTESFPVQTTRVPSTVAYENTASTTLAHPDSTTPIYTLFELQQQKRKRERESLLDSIFTTALPEFFPETTTELPDTSTTFLPPAPVASIVPEEVSIMDTQHSLQQQQREELRSPKRIRDSVEIELLNPFEEVGKESSSQATSPVASTAVDEDEPIVGIFSNEDNASPYAAQYTEAQPGQYHEINPGQYHEVNPGQYYEENPGQYHEINPGQYVHHSETEEGNPTTIQIHHRGEDKKVYNVQSKVDEFIIGEYGTISKSSGQTLQGVRYTAIGESVDSKLIYDTLIKFFNFQ